MRYILLAYSVATSISLHGYFTETVALWDSYQGRSRNIYMFGDHHKTGPEEERQIACMEQLLAEKRKTNPIHMLVEQPLISKWEQADNTVLYTLPLYAQKKHISCEDIEIRTVSTAALKLLQADYPSIFTDSFTDPVSGKMFRYNTLTFHDVVNSYEQTKKVLAKKIAPYDCSALFDKLNQGDDFLTIVKKRIGFEDDCPERVTTFLRRYCGNKDALYFSLATAFKSFLDVHAICRMQEIPDDTDIVFLAGADHVGSVAYLLSRMGTYEFHRSRRYGRTSPLSNRQLDILGMQPSGLFSGYHYARQLCADAYSIFMNDCCAQ